MGDQASLCVGQRLRAERAQLGMSVAQVARLTGVTPQAITWLERDGLSWLDRIGNLCDFYGICPGELFGVQCEPEVAAECPDCEATLAANIPATNEEAPDATMA